MKIVKQFQQNHYVQESDVVNFQKKVLFQKKLSCKFGPESCIEIPFKKCSVVVDTEVFRKIECCHYIQRGNTITKLKCHYIEKCKGKQHKSHCPHYEEISKNLIRYEELISKEVQIVKERFYKCLNCCKRK